jgi:outer membrane protein TolC
MKSLFFSAAMGMAAMAPAVGWAGVLPSPLGLEQALELATQRSQAVVAAQAGALAATQTARAAGQLSDPMLSLGIENLPVTGPDRMRTTADSMTMKRVGISQEWVSAEKRSLRQASAMAMAARESASALAAAADARLQAALAFVDAFYTSEALVLTKLNERYALEDFEAAKARFASTGASSQEVLQVTAARGVAGDDSAEVEQLHASAMVSLQRWIGVRPDGLARPALPASLDEQAFVAAHPAVWQSQRDIDLARAEAASIASNRKPNWTWEAAYAQRTGYSDMVSVGVNIPLAIAPGERQDQETAAKVALVDKAIAAHEESTRMAVAEFRALTSDAQRLTQRIAQYQTGVINPVKQRVQAALSGYRSNQVPLMALFEARYAEVQAQRKLLDLQRDLAKVQAQLAFKPVSGGAQ